MTFYAIKRLIIVLAIAGLVFHLAKPIALTIHESAKISRGDGLYGLS